MISTKDKIEPQQLTSTTILFVFLSELLRIENIQSHEENTEAQTPRRN